MTTFLRTAPLLLVALSAAADGDTRFHADLVGTQEVPAIFTAGSATLDMRVLDNDTRIEFQLAYENLTAPPLAAHVHFGQRGVSGGVSFFFCGGGGKPLCPASTSGTIAGTVFLFIFFVHILSVPSSDGQRGGRGGSGRRPRRGRGGGRGADRGRFRTRRGRRRHGRGHRQCRGGRTLIRAKQRLAAAIFPLLPRPVVPNLPARTGP